MMARFANFNSTYLSHVLHDLYSCLIMCNADNLATKCECRASRTLLFVSSPTVSLITALFANKLDIMMAGIHQQHLVQARDIISDGTICPSLVNNNSTSVWTSGQMRSRVSKAQWTVNDLLLGCAGI